MTVLTVHQYKYIYMILVNVDLTSSLNISSVASNGCLHQSIQNGVF